MTVQNDNKIKFTRFLFLISDKVQLILKAVDFEILSSGVVCNGFPFYHISEKAKIKRISLELFEDIKGEGGRWVKTQFCSFVF